MNSKAYPALGMVDVEKAIPKTSVSSVEPLPSSAALGTGFARDKFRGNNNPSDDA